MPNNSITTEVEIEEFEPDDFGENDFGFILGPDGDLKSFSIPEHLMENPPEEVIMILRHVTSRHRYLYTLNNQRSSSIDSCSRCWSQCGYE